MYVRIGALWTVHNASLSHLLSEFCCGNITNAVFATRKILRRLSPRVFFAATFGACQDQNDLFFVCSLLLNHFIMFCWAPSIFCYFSLMRRHDAVTIENFFSRFLEFSIEMLFISHSSLVVACLFRCLLQQISTNMRACINYIIPTFSLLNDLRFALSTVGLELPISFEALSDFGQHFSFILFAENVGFQIVFS